mmetsp:Transcript_20339/g.47581  ORF Transcript_20339/g.47581 Transcript_20339/m.47581 type:complete len:247 (+) Transcript_20339:146-886(+)
MALQPVGTGCARQSARARSASRLWRVMIRQVGCLPALRVECRHSGLYLLGVFLLLPLQVGPDDVHRDAWPLISVLLNAILFLVIFPFVVKQLVQHRLNLPVRLPRCTQHLGLFEVLLVLGDNLVVKLGTPWCQQHICAISVCKTVALGFLGLFWRAARTCACQVLGQRRWFENPAAHELASPVVALCDKSWPPFHGVTITHMLVLGPAKATLFVVDVLETPLVGVLVEHLVAQVHGLVGLCGLNYP